MPQVPRIPGYLVEGLLGAGGEGHVWVALEQASGRRVALKALHGMEPHDRYRLHREAALQAAIVHPHVLRVLGVQDGADELVLVLELADGGSLLDLVNGRGALSPGEVVTACAPIAQALGAVHQRGLVHGDVSCANVLFTADGRPLLADLGVARLVAEQPADVAVTPGFTAPEVLAGAVPTPAADVYSLAVTVRTALVGVMPDDPRAAIVKSPPLPASPISVIERALGSEPRNRPPADELADALFRIATPTPLRVSQLAVRPVPREAPLVAENGRGEPLGRDAGSPGPAYDQITPRGPRRPETEEPSGPYVGRRARRGTPVPAPIGSGRGSAALIVGAAGAAGAGLGAAGNGAAGAGAGAAGVAAAGSGAAGAAVAGTGTAAWGAATGPAQAARPGTAEATRSTLDAAAAAFRQRPERLAGPATAPGADALVNGAQPHTTAPGSPQSRQSAPMPAEVRPADRLDARRPGSEPVAGPTAAPSLRAGDPTARTDLDQTPSPRALRRTGQPPADPEPEVVDPAPVTHRSSRAALLDESERAEPAGGGGRRRGGSPEQARRGDDGAPPRRGADTASRRGGDASSRKGRGATSRRGADSRSGRGDGGSSRAGGEGGGRRRDLARLATYVVVPALLAGAALIGWQWANDDEGGASVLNAVRPSGGGNAAASAVCGGPAPAPSTQPPQPEDWAVVVRTLNDARSTAFADADPSELCAVYVPTSQTLKTDIELMQLYDRRGVRAQGFRFEVDSVTLVSQEAGRVVLEITDQLPPYPLVDDEGTTKATQPGKETMTWRAELLPAPDGSAWRFG